MKFGISTLIATIFFTMPAYAQDPMEPLPGLADLGAIQDDESEGMFWIGIGGGYWMDREIEDHDSGFVSAMFMFEAVSILNVYISIGLAHERHELDVFGTEVDLDVYEYPLDIGFRIYPIGKKAIRPYIDAAAGWYYITIEIEDLDIEETENIFGLKLGAGVEFEVTDGVLIDAYVAWRFLEDTSEDDIDTTSDRLDIGAGIIIEIG